MDRLQCAAPASKRDLVTPAALCGPAITTNKTIQSAPSEVKQLGSVSSSAHGEGRGGEGRRDDTRAGGADPRQASLTDPAALCTSRRAAGTCLKLIAPPRSITTLDCTAAVQDTTLPETTGGKRWWYSQRAHAQRSALLPVPSAAAAATGTMRQRVDLPNMPQQTPSQLREALTVWWSATLQRTRSAALQLLLQSTGGPGRASGMSASWAAPTRVKRRCMQERRLTSSAVTRCKLQLQLQSLVDTFDDRCSSVVSCGVRPRRTAQYCTRPDSMHVARTSRVDAS